MVRTSRIVPGGSFEQGRCMISLFLDIYPERSRMDIVFVILMYAQYTICSPFLMRQMLCHARVFIQPRIGVITLNERPEEGLYTGLGTALSWTHPSGVSTTSPTDWVVGCFRCVDILQRVERDLFLECSPIAKLTNTGSLDFLRV